METHDITKNQQFIPIRPIHILTYDALNDFWITHGFCPLLREIAVTIGSTLRTVQRVMNELEEGGYIERSKKKAWRNYRPIKHPNIFKNI